MDCVKVEGGMEIVHTVEALTKAGIPVIAHTGLTPQKALQQGGYKTQGRDVLAAVELIKEVEAFEKAGAIAVVVEAVPAEVAKIIYERSSIPILGTGCGPYSDSPMINFYDLLGFYEKNAKFAKKYADVRGVILLSLIHISRGALVVDEDLAEALNSGKVYAAGLDVVSQEPISMDNPLLSAPNCIITPHIAWAAKESRARLLETGADNLAAFAAGSPVNLVN